MNLYGTLHSRCKSITKEDDSMSTDHCSLPDLLLLIIICTYLTTDILPPYWGGGNSINMNIKTPPYTAIYYGSASATVYSISIKNIQSEGEGLG